MLRMHGDHTAYGQQLQQTTSPWDPAWGDATAWQAALTGCATADLDRLRPILATVYDPTRGRPPIDPVTLLRALGLQVIFGEPSITAWVHTLPRTPFLARLCGWAGKVPAVGTFYGFLDRLYPDRPRRRQALRRPSGRKRRLKPGEKLPPRRAGATDRVARRVAREALRPVRPRVSDAWDACLAAIVQESVRRGVLPATWDLAVDGTPVESGAHAFGRKVCACLGKRCGCLRRFSDADALVGWDSYRNRYYFGYNVVAMTVANAAPGQVAHPLVVSLALHPANRHDGVAYPDLLVKTQRRYDGTGCRIRRVIGDAAFDADALWHFTAAHAVQPVFAPHTPPEPPHLSPAAVAAGMRLGPDYRPICAADRPFVSNGWARPRVPRPVPRRAMRSASTSAARAMTRSACPTGPRPGIRSMPNGRASSAPTVSGRAGASRRPATAVATPGMVAS